MYFMSLTTGMDHNVDRDRIDISDSFNVEYIYINIYTHAILNWSGMVSLGGFNAENEDNYSDNEMLFLKKLCPAVPDLNCYLQRLNI